MMELEKIVYLAAKILVASVLEAPEVAIEGALTITTNIMPCPIDDHITYGVSD